MPRQEYTSEFKELAVKRGKDGLAAGAVARELGLGEQTLRNWVKAAAAVTLTYIWETKTPVGTIVENAYTDFAQMIVVESGPQKVGTWVVEERNIYKDYKRAFGEEPPMINGVAIMTDTDNTKERATAYYGDIVFQRSVTVSTREP